jgi:hypothetical protein
MLAPQQAWMSGLDHGEAVAFRALGFVANDQGELKRFLARSGLSPADLSQRPLPRGHLAAILDFLIDNESALLKFARAVDLPPEAAYEARRQFHRPRRKVTTHA